MRSGVVFAALLAATLSGGLVAGAGAQDAVDPAELTLEEVAAARVALMRQNGGLLRQAGGLSGDEAIAAAETLATNFAALPDYFPEGSASDGALPVIWERFDEFAAIFAAAREGAEAMQAAAEVGDADAFRASLQAIGGTCGQCHGTFRGS